jgi:septal ring factor EnvC (AmiA/AmiB activator)
VSRSRAVIAALLAGLLAGVWAGSFCERAARRRMRRQGPDVEKAVARFRRDLKLDDAQAAKVREALESRRDRHESLRRDQEARFKALRDEIDADIDKALTPGQQARFAELRARWEKEHAR